jgi:hypothetical protein
MEGDTRSIAFDEEMGPSVMVCRNHRAGGSVLDYIHVSTHPVTT